MHECTKTAADCASSAQYASGWTVDSDCSCQKKSCPSDTGLLGPSSNIVGVTAPTGQCVKINGPTSSYSGNSQCFSYSILTDSCTSGSVNPSCGTGYKAVKSGNSTCGKQCYTCEPMQTSDCCSEDPCQQWRNNANARLSELECTDMSCGSAMGPHVTEVLGHCQAKCNDDGSCGTTEAEPRWGCVFPMKGKYLDPYSGAGGKVTMVCENGYDRNSKKCTVTADATYKVCINATNDNLVAYLRYCNISQYCYNSNTYNTTNNYCEGFVQQYISGNQLMYNSVVLEADYATGFGITDQVTYQDMMSVDRSTCYPYDSRCNPGTVTRDY